MLVFGGINWVIQEEVLPHANQLQDATRTLIRNRGVPENRTGKYWVANENRIYSFELASDNDKGKGETEPGAADATAVASDNEKPHISCSACVKNLTIYQFADNGEKLQFLYRADRAEWRDRRIIFLGNAERDDLTQGSIVTSSLKDGELAEDANPFVDLRTKPNHLNTAELKRQILAADSELDQRNLSVFLEKKYTTLFLPFVMALFTAPFSLSLSRKGKAATVGYAVGLWLLFTGTSNVFEQLGLNGLLTPPFAVWSPLVIFSFLGIYLISKVRT
jgi:lipopolysaccharide export LptBFGC system permease protein LptF